MNAAGAAASLVGFGATLLGTILLLMFNPGSRGVRWYAALNAVVLLWLGTQAWSLLNGVAPVHLVLFRLAVHMLPGVFLASALAQGRRWMPGAIVLFAAAMFPVTEQFSWQVGRYWHIVLWSAGAAIHIWRAVRGRGRRAAGSKRTTRGERILELVLSAFIPIGVVGAVVIQGVFVIVVLPLLMVLILLLVFSGVVFHRYYDIEVRAARTGELAAAAAEHDRLALLGELSATIAHEIRNPLTGIRSLTQMVAEAHVSDEKRARYAGVILDEVGRLDRIVGNLTDLSRRTARADTSESAVAIGTLFEDLVLLVEARARRSDVRVIAADSAQSLHASRDALAQALLNLLLNAIAHAPAGTAVRLDADADAAAVRLHVSDEGPGIPVADRETIFEPFTTRGGTGLGLAVVRRLAAEHGWSVTVSDAPGSGARFTIEIPRRQ